MSTEKSEESIKPLTESNNESDKIHAAASNETSSLTSTTVGLRESVDKKGNKTI